jgi:E3 ubiquitin-protein ligase DOA10
MMNVYSSTEKSKCSEENTYGPEVESCRICLSCIEPNSDAFKPCQCECLVHRECLEKWLDYKTGDGKKECEICKCRFRYKREYKFVGWREFATKPYVYFFLHLFPP